MERGKWYNLENRETTPWLPFILSSYDKKHILFSDKDENYHFWGNWPEGFEPLYVMIIEELRKFVC